ncbi:MAG: HEAT repeat domain-containing protein [Desulfovermiculus sp.]|nr:HEAT repeat domain-containing protein [Desulfovermiculus sp.]
MYLTRLKNMDPWEWPEDAGGIFLQTLLDPKGSLEDRMLAAELGGDPVVMNDELAHALLQVAMNADEPEELRRQAIVSLGPALELADMEEIDCFDDSPISQHVFQAVQENLYSLFHDPNTPKNIRRSALEVSVRAESDWHHEAIEQAYSSNDAEWKLSAVFCMIYVQGFEEEILESLKSPEEMIHYHAVKAVGNWELEEAWEHISALALSPQTEKELRLTAIDALGTIQPEKSQPILERLTRDEDEDISGVAFEALGMAEGKLYYGIMGDEDDDDLEDDEDDREY